MANVRTKKREGFEGVAHCALQGEEVELCLKARVY